MKKIKLFDCGDGYPQDNTKAAEKLAAFTEANPKYEILDIYLLKGQFIVLVYDNGISKD